MLRIIQFSLQLMLLVSGSLIVYADEEKERTCYFEEKNWPISMESVPAHLQQEAEEAFKSFVELSKKEGIVQTLLATDCYSRSLLTINKNCNGMTTDQQYRLAHAMTQCFLYTNGHKSYACTAKMSVKECSANLDDRSYGTYNLIFANIHTMCLHVSHRDAHRFITQLLSQSSEYIQAVNGAVKGVAIEVTGIQVSTQRVAQGLAQVQQQQGDLQQGVSKAVDAVTGMQAGVANMQEHMGDVLALGERTADAQAKLASNMDEMAATTAAAFAAAIGHATEVRAALAQMDADVRSGVQVGLEKLQAAWAVFDRLQRTVESSEARTAELAAGQAVLRANLTDMSASLAATAAAAKRQADETAAQAAAAQEAAAEVLRLARSSREDVREVSGHLAGLLRAVHELAAMKESVERLRGSVGLVEGLKIAGSYATAIFGTYLATCIPRAAPARWPAFAALALTGLAEWFVPLLQLPSFTALLPRSGLAAAPLALFQHLLPAHEGITTTAAYPLSLGALFSPEAVRSAVRSAGFLLAAAIVLCRLWIGRGRRAAPEPADTGVGAGGEAAPALLHGITDDMQVMSGQLAGVDGKLDRVLKMLRKGGATGRARASSSGAAGAGEAAAGGAEGAAAPPATPERPSASKHRAASDTSTSAHVQATSPCDGPAARTRGRAKQAAAAVGA